MQAELTTGEIITLPKGCNCVVHHEPHWVHIWRTERDMILNWMKPLLEKMDAIKAVALANGGVSFSEFIAFEQAKLAVGAYSGDMVRIYQGALAQFDRLGIVRLIAEESDQLTDIETRHIHKQWRSLYPKTPEPEISPYLGKQTETRIKAREAL